MNHFLETPGYGTPAMYREYSQDEIPCVNRGEILRYAGIPAAVLRTMGDGGINDSCADALVSREGLSVDLTGEGDAWYASSGEELFRLLTRTVGMAESAMTLRVSYVYSPIRWEAAEAQEYPVLPFPQASLALKRNLSGCFGVIIFAATIGAGIDRLIRRYERSEPAAGALLQAAGAERVEALCDAFNGEVRSIAAEYGYAVRPRFSPGFADLPLSVQPDILAITDAGRRLGITLDSSFLMSPSKSVTGLIGLKRDEVE